MAQTTQEPLGKVEQMLVDMIDGEPIVEAPENKIQGLLMELADVIAQGGGGGGGGGITKYAQLPDKPRINDVELSGNKSFSQLGLNVQNTPVNGSNDPISSGGVYNALANKVTKETGKSLTSNDFTNALLAKLNAIESGAQVNLIEKILVNGVEVAPSNKAVALTVMTNTVENLVNYYKKSETYSQAEVDQLISQISGGITLEVVEELPETGISTSTIYLIEAGENVYTQYLYSSVDEEWKILGSTTVDLSNYYTKTQVDTLLAGKQNTLEYDNAPTASSEKMVKSGGIYNALQGKQNTLEYDNTPTEDSQKMVKSGAIWEALEGKQDTLEWDSVPTAGSTKSLTSGAIKTALDGLDAAGKADKVEGATDGDLAALDSDGNLTDSGVKASDFVSRVSGGTAGHIVMLDSDGDIEDSGIPTIIIPTEASENNKLVTASDVEAACGGGRQLPLVNLGTEYTAELKQDISSGKFEKAVVGGYLTINGHVYYLAHPDYWLHTGDTECTTHHMLVIPAEGIGTGKMNNTNITTGAYAGSDMKTGNNSNTALATAAAQIKTDFGASNILTHRELFANAVTDGKASEWAWADSDIDLMNEVMVYGCNVWASAPGYETGIDKCQIKLFQERPDLITTRASWWLRSVASATYFAFVNGGCDANAYYASYAFGVRPAFAIC